MTKKEKIDRMLVSLEKLGVLSSDFGLLSDYMTKAHKSNNSGDEDETERRLLEIGFINEFGKVTDFAARVKFASWNMLYEILEMIADGKAKKHNKLQDVVFFTKASSFGDIRFLCFINDRTCAFDRIYPLHDVKVVDGKIDFAMEVTQAENPPLELLGKIDKQMGKMLNAENIEKTKINISGKKETSYFLDELTWEIAESEETNGSKYGVRYYVTGADASVFLVA